MLWSGGQGRIKTQMLFGMVMLFVVVSILALSSFQGVAKFRKVTKSIRVRTTELPLAADLNRKVCELRVTLYRYRFRCSEKTSFFSPVIGEDRFSIATQFDNEIDSIENALKEYREQLHESDKDSQLGDTRLEVKSVGEIEESLAVIRDLWISERKYHAISDPSDKLSAELSNLQHSASQLPVFMKDRMDAFHDQARSEYQTWMYISGVNTILAVLLIIFMIERFRSRLFKPLQKLINGSRIVASGDFHHRIELSRQDEVAELAGAMNDMTSNFLQIRDDLDRQVQIRTKEVVRSEQLASVGFLAAGVAHEINNPLASIAWSAESLESRLHDIFPPGYSSQEANTENYSDEDVKILETYLRRIQEEAFRCKGITDSLLDFSRIGETEKQPTDLRELVQGVIDMLSHLGKYRRKSVSFTCDQHVLASINPQEIKQVVMNLITNSMDSLDEDGHVSVTLKSVDGQAELEVKDNGCGMTSEVIKHLFEPFFTRRRDGQGTGLGLSITYQIIADHGGTIEPSSDGSGLGSTFKVYLPLVSNEQEKERVLQVA